MSTQFEFMMQLYMMNLMQQQQQQQQQLQKDILPLSTQQLVAQAQQTTTASATPTATANTRTKNLKNSQTNSNNCSSSSSSTSSPNSNFSTHITNNLLLQQQQQQTPSNSSLSSSSLSASSTLSNLSLQQLLMLNSMPTIQQLMLQQQLPQAHALQQQSLSNLLLTPTTPTSLENSFKLSVANTQQQQQQQTDLLADYASNNNSLQNQLISSDNISNFSNYTNFSNFSNFPNLTNNQLTAKHFLQSSTVTSTPTAKSPIPANILDLEQDEDISSVGDVAYVIDDHDEQQEQQQNQFQYQHNNIKQEQCTTTTTTTTTTKLSTDRTDEQQLDDIDSDQRLSSLYSSSGIASSTSSASCENNSANSKLLLCSGVQPLESTTDSVDSSQMYTPIKQPADSSYQQTEQSLSLYREITTTTTNTTSHRPTSPILTNDDSNQTPTILPSNILTPPSSEQSKTKLEPGATLTASAAAGSSVNLTTASSLDAFLQNEENLKNLKKFTSYLECENPLCRQENLREHFHCFDEPCKGKILSKKDDIIRHLKWHKKRKESLLLGFARFSSTDDCAPEYGEGCAYNWKQTHYHCIYDDCPKVYVSTSDVQMHANFHRKNSEIVQEGFRRFRAHENCKIEDCPFYGKKISHYHCCREGCNHTFKNKADMDKHKTYHLKDYQLTQDGFKKILKTEVCPFEDCKYSTVCNHIHCVRENCNYILHSSTQMISHKRKHDRMDGEQAYQTFKKHKDSSEEESPQPIQQPSTQTSTPLSSLTAEQFLSRKRGRPPKKIQLPADVAETKRIKLESNCEQLLPNNMGTTLPGMYPPFIPNFTSNATAANTQQDPNAPNFQLTHLMALFQLQNPLFYQNLYPGGIAANMANIMGATAAAGTTPAQNATVLSNLAAFNSAAAAAAAAAAAEALPTTASTTTMPHIKTELNDNQQYKE